MPICLQRKLCLVSTQHNNQQHAVGIVTTAGDSTIETGEEVRGRAHDDISNAPLVRPPETGRGDVCVNIVMLKFSDWAHTWRGARYGYILKVYSKRNERNRPRGRRERRSSGGDLHGRSMRKKVHTRVLITH